MTHDLILAHLTTLSLAPPDMIRVASRTGYRGVGLRLASVTEGGTAYPLMDDPAMLQATRRAAAETGIAVHDIECVCLTPDLDVADVEPLLAAGAELGARYVIAMPCDRDRGRMADRFAALCALARPRGLGVVLGFAPGAAVSTLEAALDLVVMAGAPNGGVLVDTLHVAHSGGTLAALSALPRRLVPFVHLSDGLQAGNGSERLPPGEGALDLAGILTRLPPGTPVAIAVPMERMTREQGPEAVALHVRRATTHLLDQLAGSTVHA
ncbi:Xylose isomerase domain protein TIM barrel [Gluconacetobacter diazotrophicus PA1 5]|uniref:Sugar phosphate isomerase/epimerase n=2 Tax=Gluconacetobacter diazotrophicus TaxID=33996 RepID=A0A7W4FCB4_GLUDI|nr:TIM barrel protein [Gluconacetobacter diazotrophicus]ACI51172.1 Xylose isomerase domain protein TIM barrel [Gluconacetobacter diazotrophicus PA1 5]MBB2155115.1 sugar phosphate isomerase/epimerase [Gluconacetobacter diazotrophicus]TWB09728.1 sugar phosphate isomerase/epimerase [Gluconacetobacter diazotrophicus]CAP54554.1 putative xylose isomerase [Gluconacetobacter diazotrophicus PA1 5]